MSPLTKFIIRLVLSLMGAKILLHFFPFLGNNYIMWFILTGFILFMAYGLEGIRSGRLL
jgi:hypothetical protein